MSNHQATDGRVSNHMTSDQRAQNAREYAHELRAFQMHAIVYAIGMVTIIVVNWATNAAANITGEWEAWWSVWALLGWSIAIAVHGLAVRMSRVRRFGSTWEERKVEDIVSSQEAGQPR